MRDAGLVLSLSTYISLGAPLSPEFLIYKKAEFQFSSVQRES